MLYFVVSGKLTLKNTFFRLKHLIWFLNYRKRVHEYEQIVVTPIHRNIDVTSAQLNEDNEDFASRRRYHQSATVHGHMVLIDD